MLKVSINPQTIRVEEFQRLQLAFPEVVFEANIKQCQDAEVLICNPSFITEEHLNLLPKLRWIHLLMSGYNSVDLAMLKNRNIVLTNSKDVFHLQIAEDVLAKILYFNRDLGRFHEQQKKHIWQLIPDQFEIYQSTVGIIGAGSIGQEIAKRFKAFECHLLGYRKSKGLVPTFDEMFQDEEGLKSLVTRSDYLIVAIPLSKETYHLINQEVLALMKPTALFVNVARGEVVDQEALVEVLKNKRIRGAGLDVTTPEPLPIGHPLWDLENVLITSHNASSSQLMYRRITDLIISNLKKYLSEGTLQHIVRND